MSRFAIIDPGMSSLAGHHADINLRVYKELTSQGHQVEIFCHKEFPDLPNLRAINIRKAFSSFPYHFLRTQDTYIEGSKAITVFDHESAKFTQELPSVNCDTIVLFPTLFAYQLPCLRSLQHLNVFSVIHVAPQAFGVNGVRFWRLGLNTINNPPNPKHVIGFLEPSLKDVYCDIADYPYILYPIPHDGDTRRRLRTNLLTVGFIGHQRGTKGVMNLERHIYNLLKLSLKIILHDSSGSIEINHPNVAQFGYVEDISEIINLCDVVVLDYDPKFYSCSGSGVAWECIANACPVICTNGTSMERMFKSLGIGHFFSHSETESMIVAIQELKLNYKQCVSRCIDQSLLFQRDHGTGHFVKFVSI